MLETPQSHLHLIDARSETLRHGAIVEVGAGDRADHLDQIGEAFEGVGERLLVGIGKFRGQALAKEFMVGELAHDGCVHCGFPPVVEWGTQAGFRPPARGTVVAIASSARMGSTFGRPSRAGAVPRFANISS